MTSALPTARTRSEDWKRACAMLLSVAAPERREELRRLLANLHTGGAGLRMWVSRLSERSAGAPAAVLQEVLEVYLTDPEALPLFECRACRMLVPVRPSRHGWLDDEPELVYWQACPACGSPTEWCGFHGESTDTLRLRQHHPR